MTATLAYLPASTMMTTANYPSLPPAVLSTSSALMFTTEEASRKPVQPRRVSLTKKRVCFAPAVTLIPASSPLDQLEANEDGSDIWYNLADLALFRQEARDLCRHLRDADAPPALLQQSAQQQQQQPRMAACAKTRGLESRTCLERQRRKYLAVKCVVRAQSKLDDSDRLAALCERCTRWAADLAQKEAALDFVRAYGPEPQQPRQTNNKRLLETNVSVQRSVRQRLC